MRCPKCGFITFDHLENCTKCRKKIASISGKLSGTVYKAEAPSFLQFNAHIADTNTDESVDLFQENNDIDVEFSFDGKDGVSDKAQPSEEIEFDFSDESQEATASQSSEGEGAEEFNLDLFDNEPDELDLDVNETDVAEEEKRPQLDFSELDISDLAPPADDEGAPSSAEQTIEDSVDTAVAQTNDSPQNSMGTGGMLEDLQMDEFELEIPTLSSAGSAPGKKMRPSVKTGTALDEFDIDMGELISGHDN